MPLEHTFDTGEIKLNFAEGGTKGKPVMVFLHGLTGNWQAYLEEFDRLGQDWHIFALDLRGHGKSGKPESAYRLPEYAGDVIAFLQQVAQEPVVLVGHSLGALVTLTVAHLSPESVRAIIANDPPLLGDDMTLDDFPGPKMWFYWVYNATKDKPSFEQLLAEYRKISQDESESDLLANAERIFNVAPGTVLIGIEERQKEGYDLEAGLKSIRCPTLLLYGDFEQGSVVRKKDALRFQQLVPQAVIRHVPNGGHMLWWDYPEITRRHVQEFLTSIG